MEWIARNGEQASLVVLLLAALYARYRQWWVDGPTHAGTVEDLKQAEAELKKQNTTLADAVAGIKQQNATLAELVAHLKRDPPGPGR